MTMAPEISVIMSAYNAAAYIRDSVASILAQTFTDFELIVINDGSKDDTPRILDELAQSDPRIRVIHQQNTGLTIALNRALALARGMYFARQDADDISYPQRFEKELALIKSDPSIVLVGGNCDDIYADGTKGLWGAETSDQLARSVYYKTPFAHSTALMRADICRALGGYDETFKTSQDMDMWMRFASRGRIAMVQEPVLLRRIEEGSISTKRRWRQFRDAMRARWKHNRGFGKLIASYYGVRSLAIGLLPVSIVRTLKLIRASL